ncbi:hypothetical protein [Synechococcus sp. Cu2B8-bc1011]|uniref:hypothetical protein n=1 Tax=Synechococcus sp. Cu2B8-bc1011 TaxID=3093725 RepID=UPI0039B06D2D
MKILKILGSFLAVVLLYALYTSLGHPFVKVEFFRDLFKIACISVAFLAYGQLHHVMIGIAGEENGDGGLNNPKILFATAFAGAFIFYGLGLYKVGCPN